jgi:hypothetical protein
MASLLTRKGVRPYAPAVSSCLHSQVDEAPVVLIIQHRSHSLAQRGGIIHHAAPCNMAHGMLV